MKVLIKEDSLTYRNIFQSYLESLKVSFTFLEEEQVPEILFQDKFDLYIFSSLGEKEASILLDVIFKNDPKAAIVFCASDLSLERKIDYINKGIHYFLKKPFNLKKLQEILELIQPKLRFYDDLEILIAEDSEPTQKILKIYLSKQKLKVQFASDGKDALNLFANEPEKFHLIVTDINMPNMDGIELAKNIRYALENLEIPIVFLSGDEEFQNLEDFSNLANGWIQKPFSNDVYLKLLPYLEKAKVYKRQKDLIAQNKLVAKFINAFYNQFEIYNFNIRLLLHSIEKAGDQPGIFSYPIQRIKEELPLLQEFLLENASSFDFSNTFKLQQVCSMVIKSFGDIIEQKRIKIFCNFYEGLVAINFLMFQFIFYEFLGTFILALHDNQQIEINSYFEKKFFCLEFKVPDIEIKNLPISILEKIKIEFSINSENGKKIYTIKFEVLSL